MKKTKKVFLVFVFIIFLMSTLSSAYSTEKILDYTSEIYINEDATMIVEETIEVYAAGNEIKRGIYRDFPTKYKDKNGNSFNVEFEVLEVLKDGKKEKYSIEKKSNGVRVYVGDSSKTLTPGYYTYTIKYETNRQIGYFEDHDELYWNVTGNGWSFSIDEVNAIVHLPEDTDMTEVDFEAYTGEQGSKEKNYTASINKYDNTVTFTTTSKLSSEEGLTIVVGFEKGLVHEPTFSEKLEYFCNDNKGVLIGLVGVVILVIYCYITWAKYGKDPKKDVIIPRYNPPEGLSPAEVKYIDTMGKYDKVFEASLLNLAVKGYIKIENEEKKVFGIKTNKMTLIKTDKTLGNDLSEDEQSIYESLPSVAKLEYSSSLQYSLELMQNRQKKFLKGKMSKKMYSKNSKNIAISIVLSIIIMIIAFIFSDNSAMSFMIAPFMTIWLSIWTVGVVALLRNKNGAKKIVNILFAIPFLIGELVGIGVLISSVGTGIALLILLLVIINVVYGYLIKAYTEEGRRIKDEIEGFKLFIKTASEDEIMVQTPETFDKYFPYAYVLGLENEWAKKFENLLAKYQYEPNWCTGMYVGTSFDVGTFTRDFSSNFNSSISSASTPPGSSSGFSGGSSSGGGFSGGGGRRPEAAEAGKNSKKGSCKNATSFKNSINLLIFCIALF